MADIQITVQGNVRIGEYCPGNGTRYTALAVPISHDGAPIGVMGAVLEGWLVAYGLTGRAYLFQRGGYQTATWLRSWASAQVTYRGLRTSSAN